MPEHRSGTSQALKNLRAFAIILVVSFHSMMAYLASQPAAAAPFDTPPYHWIATPILDSHRWFGFDIYAAFLYVGMMPVMFLLSGLFVWPSLQRKGGLAFAVSRLTRIGIPFVFGVFLLMPFAYYPVYRVTAVDPSWSAYLSHLLALPFWPSGPLWFLWQLLLFDLIAVAVFSLAPAAGVRLGAFSAAAERTPGRYFVVFTAIAAVAYLPLAFAFGPKEWSEFGPFALQPDRALLYLVCFFAGVGIGANGYDRGLLRSGGALAQRWYYWVAASAATFILWMLALAPSFYGYDSALIDLGAYLALVAAIACACLCFAAVFVRFATGRWRLADSLAENAYAIYLVHYVFVVWMQYALLGVAMPAIAKALVVFAVALSLSWGTAMGFAQLTAALRALRPKRPAPQRHGGIRPF